MPEAHQPAVALIVGYDHRAGGRSTLASRSDTIMLLRADPETKTISLLSFPRDLLVPIYCPGKPPFTDRINAAYSVCGARGTLATVQRLTGVPINYLITVNFHGFKQVVDTPRRRLDGRRPPLLQQERRHVRDELREHQPPARATRS